MKIVPKGDLSPKNFCLHILGRIPPSHVTSLNYHVIFGRHTRATTPGGYSCPFTSLLRDSSRGRRKDMNKLWAFRPWICRMSSKYPMKILVLLFSAQNNCRRIGTCHVGLLHKRHKEISFGDKSPSHTTFMQFIVFNVRCLQARIHTQPPSLNLRWTSHDLKKICFHVNYSKSILVTASNKQLLSKNSSMQIGHKPTS